jgi:List-Bact-rpt repeat protein
MERRPLLLFVFALWLIVAQRPASAYLTDALLHLPLDYFTFLPPALGGTYVDQVFSTQVKRLTDARNTNDSSNNGTFLTFIRTEYSTMSPFNNTATRLLLVHQGYYGLYDGAGNYIKDLPFEINALSEPRWSRSDPNVLYYHPSNGNQLKQHNVATDVSSVVHTFGGYATIKGAGESDISSDGDKFVLIGDQHDIFVYTLSTDAKGPVLNITGLGSIDQLQITPDNHVLVGWGASGLARYNGIEMYDQNMNFVRQVAPAINHYDTMRDTNGDEIIVWANANDPNPVCTNGVVKVRLADASQTCLLSLDWSMAIHVSGSDGGWVLVGTYDSSDPLPVPGPWKFYTNEILQIKLDGSEIRRLVHHRSRPFPGNDYNWTPRASVSRDGTKLVYSSDYGLQQLLSFPSNYVDVYLLDGLDGGLLFRTLGVTKTGNGRVTSSPSGIDCGTDCVNAYSHGTVVTLTAIPGTGEDFLGWTGACAGQTGPCHITMDNAKVATASFTSNTGGSSDTVGAGSGGGCFIATAAFGSPLASEVQTLRTVRDRFFMTSAPGRFFITAYYRISPPFARVIAAHEWLKSAVRGALRPLVWWARLSLDSPVVAVAVGVVGLSAVPIILFMPRRARRRDS